MLYLKKILLTAILSATLLDGALARGGGQGGGNNNNNNKNNGGSTGSGSSSSSSSGGGSDLCLNPANVQTGSDQNGLAANGSEAGEVASATDPANFINFCTGKTLTNGTQVRGGSCNGVVMGDIPSTENMVSTIITFPQPGQTLQANQTFNVTLQVSGLQAGAFTNADANYYSAPQGLNGNGVIIGHSHVTIQTLGNNINTPTPPDPSTFEFFKGIDNAGNGQGGLSAEVTGGLAPGVYRVCTLSSSANHTPVLMPIAQRGAQDDCTKFTVAENAGGSGSSSGSGSSTSSSGSSSSGSGSTSKGGSSSGSGSGSKGGSSSGSGSGSKGGSGSGNTTTGVINKGGHGGYHGNGKGRFITRKFVA